MIFSAFGGRLRANRAVWALPSVPGYEIVSWPIVRYGGIRDRLPGTRNKGYLGCDGGIGYVLETFRDVKGHGGTRIQAQGIVLWAVMNSCMKC